MMDFGPPSGPEQAGIRPAVIMQDDALSSVLPTVIVVPVTTNIKRATLPSTVFLQAGEGGLPKDSVALCYQIQVRGRTRLILRLGALPAERLAQVLDEVQIALGL